ncbi:glycosyltransferase family 4 protein [Priestia endophytica]|uniref:glycosyltransferase family 4 protein n=1 Tax=Priestia endophytica TaxID=135735 RepID=UPI00227E219F|nr:glycosyltransferase family 1 protein [Priestia endophytica]MCY8234371.1 glycosyltransferase family 1 protein [Priestia endophytica]
MKIAIFTDTFTPDVNGVAKTLKRLTEHLRNEHISFQLFAPDSTGEKPYSLNVHRFMSLPFFLYPQCRLALPNMLKIRQQLQSFKPDIIHVATPFNVGLCGIHYAKKFNVPLVGSYHTDFDQYLSYYDLEFLSPLVWKYMRWFHRSMKTIFVPSQDTKETLMRHGFSNLSIWSRGVDHRLFHPHYHKKNVRDAYHIKEPYVITYVGRLAPEKNLELLMNVAQALPSKLRDKIHWLIIGDGPMKKQLEQKAPRNMSFTGFLKSKEIAPLYAASDLFFFPSTTETFGNVVLEAAASGIPTVAANAGGVKSIVKDRKTGFLCDPNNPDEFIKAVTYLLTRHHDRLQMGNEARHYALTQTWDQIFTNLLTQYEETISVASTTSKLA